MKKLLAHYGQTPLCGLFVGLLVMGAGTADVSADWSGRIVSGEVPRWWTAEVRDKTLLAKDAPYVLNAKRRYFAFYVRQGEAEIDIYAPSGSSQFIKMRAKKGSTANIDFSVGDGHMFRAWLSKGSDEEDGTYVQTTNLVPGTKIVIKITGTHQYQVTGLGINNGGNKPLTLEYTLTK